MAVIDQRGEDACTICLISSGPSASLAQTRSRNRRGTRNKREEKREMERGRVRWAIELVDKLQSRGWEQGSVP